MVLFSRVPLWMVIMFTSATLYIKALPSVLQAQAVALTVAQAFTVAFELWHGAKEGRHCTLHTPHVLEIIRTKHNPSLWRVVLSVTETMFVLTQSLFYEDIL